MSEGSGRNLEDHLDMGALELDGRPDTHSVLAGLKDFQRDTVEYAFDRLYRAPDSTRRFLVADEVGLGKTLVARGVIAKAIDHLWKRVDRIDILYICSNAQIARQNVRRLQQVGSSQFVRADRLTLLPREIQGLRGKRVNYLAFTPGTSFNLRSSLGRADERVLLYHLVQRAWPDTRTGPKNLFQGWVRDAGRWRWWLNDFKANQHIDNDLAQAFRQRLGDEGEDLRAEYSALCRRFKRIREHVPGEDRWEQASLIGRLRSLLAEVCVTALEPDLLILDEFQRFKTLLDGEGATAQLAKRLFTYSDETSEARLLLLSATPYRMYTLHHESHEDDHYRDFLRTVEFLDPELKESGELRRLLGEYRQAFFQIESGTRNLERIKNSIESHLRRVVSRTERLQASADAAGMLREVPSAGLEIAAGDVQDFLALDRIGREVRQPQVLEYWKSAPYLLSFMDEYKLKTEVVARLEGSSENGLARLLKSGKVFLSWADVEAYAQLDPANARLRSLMQWLQQGEGWKLLWLPAALPYYADSGPWQQAREHGFSKRLVFSTWNVVPKTIASLVSYEAERRIFQRFKSSIRNTPEERKKRRPLLRFAYSDDRLTGMPVLGILYPSPSLAELGDPLTLTAAGKTLDDILALARQRLGPALLKVTEPYLHMEREDESWYWAAPILLDLAQHPKSIREWFNRWDLPGLWSGTKEDRDRDSRWRDHVEHAKKLVNEAASADETVLSKLADFGRPPRDLAEVLAAVAVAGPATSALRALTRASDSDARSSLTARDCAAQIASGFRTLFNLPETTALVRGERPDDSTPYWRQVVEYCAAGNFQAVLDEYVHTLRDLEGLFATDEENAWKRLAEAIIGTLSLRTGTPRVDDLRRTDDTVRIERHHLRNHLAIRFGAQERDDGQAGAREGQVRRAFNSPFWPFVLASTSVGQEGLDFHAYCHSVVHWNLPSNPVDLEQREGRIHRYKGHAVRKNVAAKHGAAALADDSKDVWNTLFEIAGKESSGGRGLVPYWIFPLSDGAYIERHVPVLPLSRDEHQLEALRRSLAVYRMVFGQPRQDDLLAFLLARLGERRLREIEPLLRIDLSPPRAHVQ